MGLKNPIIALFAVPSIGLALIFTIVLSSFMSISENFEFNIT